MGAVYLGRRPEGAQVALKVMLDPDRSETGRERFRRECQALEELDHPGIVKLLGADLDTGYPCLVLEFVEGRDLEAALAAGDLELDARLDLVEQACRGVHHAHRQGIVHRDMKPANILIDGDGRAKVTDFGLVRALDRETRLTKTGAAMGTPGYMSPEQVRGLKDTGPATDVFSLGVILYEAITNELPFQGDTAVEMISKIVNEPPAKPSSVCAWAGPRHDAVVLKALAKDPELRHGSAGELADAIADLRARGGGSAVPRVLARLGAVTVVALALVFSAVAWTQRDRVLSPEQLKSEGETLSAAAQTLLATPKLLAVDAAQARALFEREKATLAGAPKGEILPRTLHEAAIRLVALRGLLALTEGETDRATELLRSLEGRETSEMRALRGGIAALTTAGDPRNALRDLSAALRRGVRRLDLRAWRLRARARVGAFGARDAEETLKDVATLREARGLTPGESATEVLALLALGQHSEAQQAFDALNDPPSDLGWTVALASADRALETDPEGVLNRLQALPTQEPLDPRRETMRDRALGPVRSMLAEVGQRYALTKAERSQITTGLRLAFALWPEEPPEQIVTALMDKATSFKGSGDYRLALCLGDVCPNNKEIQLGVGYLAQRIHSAGPRRSLLPYLRRALELESNERARRDIKIAMCVLIGSTLGRSPKSIVASVCEECVALSTELLPNIKDDEERAEVLNARACSLRALGDQMGALRDVDDAIELAGGAPGFYLTRMRIRLDLGRKPGALDDAFKYAIQRAGNDPSVKSNEACILVWTLGREAGQEKRVLDTLRAMVRGRPQYIGWRVRLAYLQLRAKAVARARANLAEALERQATRARFKTLPDYVRRLKDVEAKVRARGADALPELEAFVEWLEVGRIAESEWAVGY